MTSFEKIYNEVIKIPKGKVSTYKKIALLSGVNNPRVVGFALHANKNPDKIPCHRVVKNNGYLAKGYAYGGIDAQKEKLQEEGVLFLSKYLVDLNKNTV